MEIFTGSVWSIGIVAAIILSSGSQAIADDLGAAAGKAEFVIGAVQVTHQDKTLTLLKKGDTVRVGDLLETGQGASAQIEMGDGGKVFVRPDSRLNLDSFVYKGPKSDENRNFFSLLRGGMRAVTGFIGHLNPSHYSIVTPNATIGVRGTDHEVYVVVLDSKMSKIAPTGTYDKVNSGLTTMTTQVGDMAIMPGEMGYAHSPMEIPRLVPVNLDIFTVVSSPTGKAEAGTGHASIADAALLGSGTMRAGALITPGPQTQIPAKGSSGVTGGLVF